LRGKNKSLLEDILILFTGGILIYFTYSFFFSSNEKEEIIENPQTIEKKEETITPQPIINEIKKEEITLPKVENKVESKIENKVEEIQKEKPLQKVEENTTKASPITPIPIPVVVEKSVQKEPEKPAVIEQTKELDDKARIDAFYKTIKEKIYLNIDKNIDKSLIKKGEFVNLRLTIFKDGRYEQLTLIEGNNENFELIKSSITQSFPVIIDDSLKANFPRYFRMKIEF
jgi:hypothetical protein